MSLLQRKFVSLSLALAWVLAPVLHLCGHLAESHQHPISRSAEAYNLVGTGQSGLHLHAKRSSHSHSCEICQGLAHNKGLSPVFQALAPVQPSMDATDVASQEAPRSSAFLFFDHRGPPVQA
jgi:hypothetical protein